MWALLTVTFLYWVWKMDLQRSRLQREERDGIA